MASGGGLSQDQIDQLRADVAAGKAPRVRITGPQLGGTDAGTVRAVGDPATDGEDFVTVRVTINGVTDDLPFTPSELSRGRAAKAPTAPPAKKAPAKKAPAKAAARSPRPPAAAPAAKPVAKSVAKPAATPAAPMPATPAAPPRKASRRTPPGAPVSIVLTSKGTAWTVSAQRGARSVVKAAPVNPGIVSAVAAMLGVSALEDAVAAVNDTARAEAESRAEQLRAELAQIQDVLDSHRRP